MNVYIPSSGPDDWQRFLAEPTKHWRPGYSAQAVALSWENSAGIPAEIDVLLGGGTELLIAIPEHKVPLPGGSRASQCDVFALVRQGNRTISLAVEGKVHEPFGPTIAEWLSRPTPGKTERLGFIERLLGRTNFPAATPYQLLHRTAASILEARRFKTDCAAMVVQSFSPDASRFEDYAIFSTHLGLPAQIGALGEVAIPGGVPLLLGWAQGDPQFLVPSAPVSDTLYERDFFAWTQQQGSSLRTRSRGRVDWENLAEEIESLGRSDKRQIESRLGVLLAHLLKWRFQPGERSNSWKATLRNERRSISRLIQDSPSLRNYPAQVVAQEYGPAVARCCG